MIDNKTKQKLLKEIEKSGNIWSSCVKLTIHRSTYHRWKETDKEFKKMALKAERQGRENICDIAKHALMINVKEKKMDAIKYTLSHLDPAFKRKQGSNVIIWHKKDAPPPVAQIKTLEDLISDNEKSVHEYGLELKERFTQFGGQIPNKPDGSPIEIDELPSYVAYIENWQKHQRQKKTTDTADSKSEMDNPPVTPPENQKTLDIPPSNPASLNNPRDNNT